MKNKKMIFIGIIIGVVISSVCFVVADTVINSDHVTFKAENNSWNATTVDGALNDLYTYASSYKNLNQNTTFSSDDLVLGKTAYNKDGVLVTGTHKESCEFGTKILTADCTTSTGCVAYDGFVPTKFLIIFFVSKSTSNYSYHVYDTSVNSTKFFNSGTETQPQFVNLNGYYKLQNNKLTIINFDNNVIGQQINYMVCK